MKMTNDEYKNYTDSHSPRSKSGRNMLRAFLVGGAICLAGQALIDIFMALGTDQETACTGGSVSLVFLGALLTGLGVYDDMAKFAGAGTLVPITGFANSVAAPAIEFQKEGMVFGIGCKIFNIAGPVILYGIASSWVLGLIYWILKLLGIA